MTKPKPSEMVASLKYYLTEMEKSPTNCAVCSYCDEKIKKGGWRIKNPAFLKHLGIYYLTSFIHLNCLKELLKQVQKYYTKEEYFWRKMGK